MSDGQSLAQTLTARMQLGVLGTSNTIAHGIRVSRKIAEALKVGGGVRPIKQKNKETIRLSSICTIGKRIEAYAGYLYMVVGLRKDVTITGGRVAYGTEDAVSEIDVLPYGDVRQRIGLKQYSMTYRLLNRMLQEPDPPRLIILDHTLLLPSEFASSDDPDVQKDYQHLSKNMNDLWEKIRGQLAPWNPAGIIIVGLPRAKRLMEPLNSIARGNQEIIIDPLSPSVIKTVTSQSKVLEDVGAARVMGTVLWPDYRSVAFAYSGMNIDPRTEPKYLIRELDIASFHYRAGLRASPLQVEIPGTKSWTPEGLDDLASRLRASTLFDQHDAVPLPVWLGRKQLDTLKAKKILEQYQRATFQVLRSGELDAGWLSGWEPEGGAQDE